MLFEDPSVDTNSDKRFHVELHFSSGSFADFDNHGTNSSQSTSSHSRQNQNEESAEDISHNSTENESLSPRSSAHSTKCKSTPSNSIPKSEKKSPFSSLTKRFPIKFFTKELQTLPEPGDISVSFEANPTSLNQANDSKPRSFEDEQHQNKLNIYKAKNRTKDSYSHYNTFHGSEAYNYLSIAQVFRNKSLNNGNGTNSSPDLNQHLLRHKKSHSGKNIICTSVWIRIKFQILTVIL